MNQAPWIFMIGLTAFMQCAAMAQTPEAAFSRGNELYRAGKFQDAAKEYDGIIKEGKFSAELYFNLGNAYYREGRLAQAILAYERAAQLNPDDPDIEHNLKLAYLKTVDRIEPVPDMFLIQWLRAVGLLISSAHVRIIFIVSWVLLFCSLATMYLVLHPVILHTVRIVFFVSCASVVLWAAMIGIQSFRDTAQDKAIIIAQTVTAKSSPDVKSVDAFVIHEGVKVKLTDMVGGWVKATLIDGKVGWIPADQCERI